MGRDVFEGMMSSGKITDYSGKLVSVDSVNELAGGAVLCVTATTRESFKYGDNAEDDVVKSTFVMERGEDGKLKIAHGHRATGQKPDDAAAGKE